VSAEASLPGAAGPLLLVVNPAPALGRALERDLRREYGQEGFEVTCVESGSGALELLDRLCEAGRDVALVLVTEELDGTTGTDVAARAREVHRDARTVLTVPYSAMTGALEAMNRGWVDYFFVEPLGPLEGQLFPVVSDLLDDWRRWREHASRAVQVEGVRDSRETHAVCDFLSRNDIHYRFIEPPGGAAAAPSVTLGDGRRLPRPSVLELAQGLGLPTSPQRAAYDLVVVGGGPAGLAAAVYGSSEGLDTLLVESYAPGGQAGQSARIENYLGFPAGVKGGDLAQRALRQARRFRAEIVRLKDAAGLRAQDGERLLRLSDGSELRCRAAIVACGVAYRRLEAPGVEDLVGRGIYYGAAVTDAQDHTGRDVVLVGGANSAGQAALHFAQFARRVTMLVRADSLERSMSRYLIDRIEAAPNVEVRARTRVVGATGDGRLECLTVAGPDGAERTLPAESLFVFIGAVPCTEWLRGALARDERGFILSGRDLAQAEPRWPEARDPFPLETSVPGVFAAGDVRHGSVKRVASAVGEGSMAVQLAHDYLAG
jgi:thioredoxin reductase (NADPH)